jgi:hypothetical protein
VSETMAIEEHTTCVTHESSSCSRYGSKTTTITIRVPLWLFQKLKEKGVQDISRFVRQFLVREIHSGFSEEEGLEYELQTLKDEMSNLQEHHTTLLKHGSYAKDYLNKLKDGVSVTHKPFTYSKAQTPTLSQEEIGLVNETVNLREELARQYCSKLKQLLEVKKQRYRFGRKDKAASEITISAGITTVSNFTESVEVEK